MAESFCEKIWTPAYNAALAPAHKYNAYDFGGRWCANGCKQSRTFANVNHARYIFSRFASIRRKSDCGNRRNFNAKRETGVITLYKTVWYCTILKIIIKYFKNYWQLNRKACIMIITVPRTPLNNAYHAGSFDFSGDNHVLKRTSAAVKYWWANRQP